MNNGATASAGPVKPFAGRRTRCTNKLVYPCRAEGWLNVCDRDLQIGHRPANVVKDKKLNFVTWEPYFCVLLQDEQTLTAYRSEELSIFPGTALRTITHAFKLMERRQRSIPIPYSYGYHYNPIEPSMGLDGIDSRINTFKPMCQNVKTSTHDLNSVPRTQYQLKNPLYDTEYISVRDIPSLFPEEDSYDYKYLSSPLYKYLTGPSTQESGISINLLAIKKTSVFDYGFPTYKSPYSSDSVWIHGSNIPNTVFEDPQSVESDPDTLRVSSSTVKIVKLLPETSEQDSIITTTKNDELDYKTTQETPTEAELYPTTSEELRTEDEPSYITTEETMTEDKSNPITSKELRTEDEPSYITTEETMTEDKSNPITSEETMTEDKSNPITSKELRTEDASSFLTTEETLTEDKSNPITLQEFQTEDESNFLTEGTQTEVEFNSIKTEDKSNHITTDENQQEDDESMSMTSQETTTAFNLNDELDTNRFSSIILRINDLMKKIKDQQNKSQFRTIGESTNQQFEPQLANGADTYEEY